MIAHEFDGIKFQLHPDGALTFTLADDRVDLSPEATFALVVFLQLPGTRPTIRTALMERRRLQAGDEA